jgi:hypothetical protein
MLGLSIQVPFRAMNSATQSEVVVGCDIEVLLDALFASFTGVTEVLAF